MAVVKFDNIYENLYFCFSLFFSLSGKLTVTDKTVPCVINNQCVGVSALFVDQKMGIFF